MATDNKAIARRLMEAAWKEGDFETAGSLLADDYVGHSAGMGKTFRSIDDLREFVETMKDGFPDLSMEIEEQVADGDTVVNRWIMRGTHDGEFMGVEPTGRSIEMSGIGIFHLDDGKVAEAFTIPDTITMMRQLGLVPEPARA